MEVEVWVQVLESSSECLPAQWRDRYVPIMCSDLNSPNHPAKNSGAVKAAWCQLGWREQTYASLRKILMKVHIDVIN